MSQYLHEEEVVTPGVEHAVCDNKKKQFPVESHLADRVHCEAATFSFFLSNQGLGTSSPTELPYPSQASVFEAGRLKHRLMESPRVLAMRAQNRSLGLSFGIRACMQWVTIISIISARLLGQQVCLHRPLWLISVSYFSLLGQPYLILRAHGCSLCRQFSCVLLLFWRVIRWCKCAVIR